MEFSGLNSLSSNIMAITFSIVMCYLYEQATKAGHVPDVNFHFTVAKVLNVRYAPCHEASSPLTLPGPAALSEHGCR